MDSFEVRLAGEGVSPETVSLSELAQILHHLERAVLAAGQVKQKRKSKNRKPRRPLGLSLIGVGEGSDRLRLAVPANLRGTVLALVLALHSGDYSQVNWDAKEELYRLSNAIIEKKWSMEFEGNAEFQLPPARISVEKPVPPPSAAQTITGPTTLYGVLVKIGGVNNSKAEMRLHGKKHELISVLVEREQATLLAKRLYQDVCLEGEATWLMPSMEVVSFWPTKIVDFAAPDPKTGFDELRAQSGGAWDAIDVDKFVKDQRADDDVDDGGKSTRAG